MTALREIFATFTTRFDGSALRRGAKDTDKLQDSLRQLGAFLVGGLSVAGVRSLIQSTVELGDEIDKVSQQTGVSAEVFQRWRTAAELSGVQASSLRTGFIRLSRNMLLASEGTGEAKDALDRLGISATDSSGALRPIEDVLMDLAQPLSEMESATERTAILTTLLGRSGAELAPLFAQGSAGVRQLLRELDDLGGPIGEDAIQASVEAADEITRFETAASLLKTELVTQLLPAFTSLVAGLRDIIVRLRENRTAAKTFGIVMVGALAGIAAAFAPFVLVAGAAAVATIGLGLVVDDLWVTFQGGDSVLGRSIDGIEEWSRVNRNAGGATGIFARVLETLGGIAETVGIKISQLLQILARTAGPVRDFFNLIGADPADLTSDAQLRERTLRQTGGLLDLDTAEGRRAAREIDETGDVRGALDRLAQTRANSGNTGVTALGNLFSNAQGVRAPTPPANTTNNTGGNSMVVNNNTTVEVSGAGDEALSRTIRQQVEQISQRNAEIIADTLGQE